MKLLGTVISLRHIYRGLDYRIVLPCYSTNFSNKNNVLKHFYSQSSKAPQICVVGSGPAGFYTTMQLLKSDSEATVDIYEKLPVPYGLVRYGVAPDHPEVKNCISSFHKTLMKERCNFYGNVSVGKDVTVSELREHYHAVVFASGAWEDRKLDIPGEDHIMSARRLVGWYNGLPADTYFNPPLHNSEHVAIIGHGNVALDVARILLTPLDMLQPLDIPEPVLDALSHSKVNTVTLIGRRAVQYSAFTTKEFREMTKLPAVGNDLKIKDCKHIPDILNDIKRPKRRLMQLIHKTAEESKDTKDSDKIWDMKFLRSPLNVEKDCTGKLNLDLGINRMEGDKAVATGETETLQCDLILRSIGYLGTKFDDSLPYDQNTLTLANHHGRVNGLKGVYATGWAGSGPVGVIVNTMGDSIACAKTVISDLRDDYNDGSIEPKQGSEAVLKVLKENGVSVITEHQADQIMEEEKRRGKELGKIREKITNEDEMKKVIK